MIKAEIKSNGDGIVEFQIDVKGGAKVIAEEFATFACSFAKELNARSVRLKNLGTIALTAALDQLFSQDGGKALSGSTHITLLD